ncbi:VOC family protein [Nakamurella lactea]|uniref:VOC family protein n=1 Tax=Nakamurella lactea TaxID=459515 RepID=UPI0003FA15FB|nr:VOC family protein [Nakamurella lactea]
MTLLNPYLSFRDTAKPAMEFYQGVFGGELTLNTFGDSQMADDPADGDKIMHGMLTAPNGLTLMGADTPSSMELTAGNNITVSLSGDDESELRGYWDKLADGGSVTVPLEKAPWGDTFGMCTDRFGVAWMVNIAGSAG